MTSKKNGRVICVVSFQDDATSRRTSIEWCDSKGSVDLYDSIQEADGCTRLHYWNATYTDSK